MRPKGRQAPPEQLTAELGLPDGLLASRKHLESLLESGTWPSALAGWRQQQLEPLLRPLLPTH